MSAGTQRDSVADRLTDVGYWNDNCTRTDQKLGFRQRICRALLGDQGTNFFRSGGYFQQLIVQFIDDHLNRGVEKPKAVELGSAPGRRLVFWRDRLDVEPYGVEYAKDGAETNQHVFRDAGIDVDNVIHADIFDGDFQSQYQGTFDLVSSFGLIEHFAEASEVIEEHVNLLKPGGLLVIGIPNLRGLNYWLTSFFHPEVLPLHNLQLMKRTTFQDAFQSFPLDAIYSGYMGLFSIRLQNTKSSSWKRKIIQIVETLEAPFELIQWALLPRRLPTIPWLSPYLAFIGRKCSQ